MVHIIVMLLTYSNITASSCIRGVVANYLASQARDPGIDSHQHRKRFMTYMAPSEERYCV